MAGAVPTPEARRMRRFRQRKREGAKAVRTDLRPESIAAMVEDGWVGAHELEDPEALGAAVADIIDCWCRGTLQPRRPPESVTP